MAMVGVIVLFLTPSNAPGSEWAGLGLIMFTSIFLVTLAVGFIIFILLKKFTDPRRDYNARASIIITIIFLVLLTLGICYAYVRYTT